MQRISKCWLAQIEVTTKCGKSCLYCSRFDRHLRPDQRMDMSLETFDKALFSLKDWPILIGIIGWEPEKYKEEIPSSNRSLPLAVFLKEKK